MWRMCFPVPEYKQYGNESHSIILKFLLKESISMVGKVSIPDLSLWSNMSIYVWIVLTLLKSLQ